MKIIPLFLSLFCAFFSIGQKSYYFSNALPPEGSALQQIDPRYFGNYAADNGTMVYVIDENGVLAVSTKISSISRKTLRESSQYEVRNGHIFGVVAGDSLPCVLEDDNYFFGVRSRDVIVGEGSMNTLKSIGKSQYVLNYYEKGAYLPVLLKFGTNGLEILDFDYELETTLFDFIETTQQYKEGAVEYVSLNPTQAEFDQLMATGIFAVDQIFKKIQEE